MGIAPTRETFQEEQEFRSFRRGMDMEEYRFHKWTL